MQPAAFQSAINRVSEFNEDAAVIANGISVDVSIRYQSRL